MESTRMEPTNPTQPNNQPTNENSIDPSALSSPVSPQASTEPVTEVQAQSAPSPVTSSTATTDPVVASGPVVNGVQPTVPSGQMAEAPTKKKWLVPALAGGALLTLLTVGYVFGLYLPNKPEAVFSKSLSQSGLALDKLIEYTQEQQKNPAKSASLDGSVNVKAAEASFDMTMKGKSSANEADITMDANFMGQKLKADLRMLDAEGSDNPDLYFKVEGAKGMIEEFGGDASQIAPYENKWIAVDHTILDTLTSQAAGTSLSTNPTTEQLNDALSKVQQVNREYLFTDDASKSVVLYKSFEGKTTKDGRDVNHYKVSYSKDNLKSYVKALIRALDESKLNEWYKEQSGESFSKSMQLESLEGSIKDAKDGYVFDMYVDTKTKLMHSLVFTNPDNSKESLTLYQKYNGGSAYPLGLKFVSDEEDSKTAFDLGITANTDTDVIKVTMDIEMGSNVSGTTTVTGAFTITPSNEEVKVEKPSGAMPFTTVMNQLGAADGVLGAFTGAPSQL